MPRRDGPFKILEKVNDNAHKLELPGDIGESPAFNVGALTPYLDDEENGDNLRANHNEEGEDESSVMPTQVQESSHILLNAHKLHQRGLSPCTDLDLQFLLNLKPFRCSTLIIWEGQQSS